MSLLPTGKLPAELLGSLLSQYPCRDESVLLGPALGEDAAVIDLGKHYLVTTTDPITFASKDIGWYAVQVNANDVACCGATPRWFLATLLLPVGCTESLPRDIFAQIHTASAALGVSVVGGHTEITRGIDRPLVIGQMMGLAQPAELVRTGGAKPGDHLLLTKAIALEGTAILAVEKAHALANVLDVVELERCAALLKQPGISVVEEASIARSAQGVHAMHDPTEGGLATGLLELAGASNVGLLVEDSAIPLVPGCAAICAHLGLDPLGLIASGSLLISVAAEHATPLLEHFAHRGIEATRIGKVCDFDYGVQIERCSGRIESLPVFERDEIARAFD